MIDSHIHLSHHLYEQTFPYVSVNKGTFDIQYIDRDSLIEEMKNAGITCCIEPAIDVKSNELLLNLSQKYPEFILPAIGNHPTRCIVSSLGDFKKIRSYAEISSIVAIGETGLDYHYKRTEQHRLRQKIWFQWHINLANQLNLPLILHIRMADNDAIRILRKNKKRLHGGVCHCFGGGPETAKIYTDEFALCLGIGGTLLMGPEISGPLHDAVKQTPLEYLILETDGPYVKPMRPDGFSKKAWGKARNTSLILPAVANRIAEIKDISTEDVLRITEENTKRIFRI